MDYQVFISKRKSDQKSRSGLTTATVAVLVISIFVTAVWFYPSTWSYISGALCLTVTFGYFIQSLREKYLFLDIREDTISYHCLNTEELVCLQWEDLSRISSKFCTILLHTKSGERHAIDLMMLDYQARFRLKDRIKQNCKKYGIEVSPCMEF
ncbi:hypothetical protein [Pedobacter sp. SYSU D00535]|uniref:hypothetical protein n=1 Tax=Pedobacter sp. SYSU D00535 TaxID=2810308 RepID=UPI001A958D6F|nr:hypothetical protein [Pedobacter sp. SYSU D00535]